MSKPLRIVFAGTPEFAVPALEALAQSRHAVVAVLTQPDRLAGRGRKLTASAVKRAAERIGLPIEQPATLKDPDSLRVLAKYAPDILVVVAYGLILPQTVLDLPRLGCVNVHASLLPRWRGAAPIERALLAGDRETGISIMRMEAGLDTGPVYARFPIAIGSDETAGSLRDRLAALGAHAIIEIIESIAAGTVRAEPQNSALASHAPKIDKAEARIDWMQPADAIERRVRAFNPRPVAECRWKGEQLRIWAAHVVEREIAARPGTIIESASAALAVACGSSALALDVLQLAGRRVMTAEKFLAAHDPAGVVLE